ncbi:NADP-dependent oxidoreductase [Actinacidiphila sp. ITFR-21]|uniref:NADP-dependent oxidoreductase n=1 Tax=Actinacidiphila sp. ITFR-21 TaxID=3075199 RepID=UPI00288A1C9E|nr:NADP-dependent oxidoreductase [Streptomyces sp. ITFR-21]WNI16291.1 NADP-dependent oxidoreductase [Streptomyces sp. ITFR-21]
MKVLGVNELTGPDALQVFEIPTPEPGPGEIRIRVHAAAVNHTDVSFMTGAGSAGRALAGRRPPHVPGMDAAGVVDRIGPETDGRLSVGDRVVALVVPTGPHGGAYAEYVVVPAASAVPAPANVDFAAAATLPLNGVSAQLALEKLDLPPGRTVAVTGAAGAVGGFTVQLAKAAGLRVVADTGPADKELIESLGADLLVDRGPAVAATIRAALPDGVDGLVDAAVLDAAVLPAIADGGALAVLLGWDGPVERDITLHKVITRTANTETDRLDLLCRQVEAGLVTPRVAQVFPADQARAAHTRFAAGGLRGRLVLDFSA